MNFNWTRKWIFRGDRDSQTNTVSSSVLWESLQGYSSESKGFKLGELNNKRVSILLGEPGIGKSDELRRYFENPTSQTDNLLLHLQPYPPDDFYRLFDLDKFDPWRSGTHQLHICFDAFDENQRTPLVLGRALDSALSALSLQQKENIFIKIVCRTADWSEETTTKLEKLFGQHNVWVMELDALSQADIRSAALQYEIDPNAFLEEIDRKALTALILKPITLIELLKVFKQNNGVLPDNRIALYKNMCERLCEEENAFHAKKRKYSNVQLFQEAARLAAIMLTSQKTIVWTASSTRGITSDAVAIDQLYDADFEREKLKATLNTGFFVSRGENRLGWAHQSYAEFLAAHYLHNHVSPSQRQNLVVHSDGECIVPQLREVAAWLAAMSPAFLDFFADLDPKALMQSELISEDHENRERLTNLYLDLLDREEILETPINSRTRYQRLNQANLAKQINAFVADESHNKASRREAIYISYSCELHDTAPTLIELALDKAEDYYLRSIAAYVASQIGSAEAKLLLKPLIYGGDDDIYDELKGAALIANWPHALSATELFSALTPQKKSNLSGNYVLFLRREIVHLIDPEDLPIALIWAARFVEEHTEDHYQLDYVIAEIIDEVILKSWAYVEDPKVCEAFALLILAKISHFSSLFGTHRIEISKLDEHYQQVMNEFLADNEKRRGLLIAAVRLITNPEYEYYNLKHSIPLLREADLDWLLELLRTSYSPISHETVYKLIDAVFSPYWSSHMNSMSYAIDNFPALEEKYRNYLCVKLNSEYAKDQRSQFQYRKELERKRAEADAKYEEQIIEPPSVDQLIQLLELCEKGSYERWWETNLWLSVNEYGKFGDWSADMRRMPRWTDLSEVVKQRLIDRGIDFLHYFSPEAHVWTDTGKFRRPSLAGYRILFLLFDEGFTISSEIMKKWTSTLIEFPHHFIDSDHEKHVRFLEQAYINDPSGFVISLEKYLAHWSNPNLDLGILDNYLNHLGKFAPEDVTQVLVRYLNNPNIKPEHFRVILTFLVLRGTSESFATAIGFILSLREIDFGDPLELSKSSEDENTAIQLASFILFLAPLSSHRNIVWEIMLQSESFGRRVIAYLVRYGLENYDKEIEIRLSFVEAADLFLLAGELFPIDEDPKPLEMTGFYTVTYRHNLARWRNSLLEYIAAEGTIESLRQLDRISETYPNLRTVKVLRKRLIEKLHERSWHPPQLSEILGLFRSQEARLIQSNQALMDVVIESLQRLQDRLQGETPSAQFLWNIVDKEGICRPKDERSLSNYIRQHLDQDLKDTGIIVNREVEIRSKQGGVGAAPGEIPDLYVSAIQKDDSGTVIKRFSVLIEVKGNWNTHVLSSMKTQLYDRYLADNDQTNCGLYVVGWFNCPQWDENDRNRASGMRHQLEDLRQLLNHQAEELSANGKHFIRSVVLDASLRNTGL